MHENTRFGKIVRNDFFKRAGNDLGLLVGHRISAVRLDIPLRKQIDFPLEHGVIVRGQCAFARSLLPEHEFVGGCIHQPGSIVFIENIKVGLPAQIAHENKSLRAVGGENARHVHAGLLHERINF